MITKILKDSLEKALIEAKLDVLPDLWDGVSTYSKAIVKLDSSMGEIYAIAKRDKDAKYGIKVIQSFYPASHNSNPKEIYPISFLDEVPKNPNIPNTSIIYKTPEEKQRSLELDRIAKLDIPYLENREQLKAWLIENKALTVHLDKSSETKLRQMVIRMLYKREYNEKLTIDLNKEEKYAEQAKS